MKSFNSRRSVIILCLILVFSLAFASACQQQPSGSSEPATESSASPAPASSEPASTGEQSEASPTSEPSEEPFADEPSPEPSEDSSEDSEPDASSETPDPQESSEDEPASQADDPEVLPEFVSNFVSFGAANTGVRANSAGSVQLTGVNTDPVYGGVILYTFAYGSKLTTSAYKDYAFFAYGYNPEHFVYELEKSYEGTLPKSVEIPNDGFLIAVHKDQTEMLNRLKNADPASPVYPHGVQACPDLQFTVKKASGITIDGSFGDAEWSKYKIEDIGPSNPSWSYAQFEKDNYYSTAEYYEAYDDNYFYLCVVVSSPYHYCPVTPDKANEMWQYECIQVKFSSESPDGEYILQHYDHVIDGTANNDGIVRAYGFAVNDAGETCYYENSPVNKVFGGQAVCTRDDATQKTVYEVAIPFSEYGIQPKKGMKIGVTFSVNSTNADDIAKKVWKNITYRDGGGVIGRNDWAKIPVITLG